MQIWLKNVSKQYEKPIKCWALRGVDLAINNGESIALTGKSGCGKSTLLNVIAGLTIQSSGEYWFNDKQLDYNQKQMARFRQANIGIIVQNFALLNDRTAFDNICLGITKNRIDQDEVFSIAGALDIEDKLERFPFQLSGGECQRVAIARAVIKKPSIILADEPTGALDSINGDSVISILMSMKKLGTSLIIATHDDVIASKCDRKIVMSDGKIVTII